MSTIVAASATSTEQSLPKAAVAWCLKTVALWLALLVGATVASIVIHIDLPAPLADGPLTVMQAFLLVNGLIAVALALVAASARVSGWRLGVLLLVAYFAIGVAMMQIETLWFNDSLKLPLAVIGELVANGAIAGAFAAIAGALLFRPAPAAAGPVPATLTHRIVAMALLYVVLYYTAGALIAWQSAAVRAYYENGIHIPFWPTVGFQVFRGTLWALISLYIVARMKGSLVRRALVMGMMFSVLTAAQLLYPTSFFPWAVRSAHLLEVGTSEFAYGILVTLVLLGGAARHPLVAGIWRALADQA